MTHLLLCRRSASDPPLASADSGLAGHLTDAGVTDVFVVGLAGDFCVLHTALDARTLGWRTYVVQEGTRCVGGEQAWEETSASPAWKFLSQLVNALKVMASNSWEDSAEVRIEMNGDGASSSGWGDTSIAIP